MIDAVSIPIASMALHFGQWALDTDARLLRRGDEPIHLRGKTFDLLLVLVAERPRAVAKSELLERVWPGTFVQEANLSNAIGELRKALDDRGSASPVIRTVHTFGYAFAATVDEDNSRDTMRARAHAIVRTERLIWGSTVIGLAETDLIVGRDDSAGVVLGETTVSRRHARLFVTGNERRVEDLGSQNGTWVNEQRVTAPTLLADGDRIRFGRVLVTYRCLAPTFTTERLPSE